MADCYLSAQNRALSTAFSSVVGSVLLPLIHGPTIAFFVAWNCYFGVVRMCLVSAAGLFVTFFGPRFGIHEPFIAVDGHNKRPHNKHPKHHGHRVGAVPFESLSHDHHDESHDTDIEGGLEVDAPEGSWQFGFKVFSHITKRNKKVGILGAMGLVYSLIYTPVVQVVWLRANWKLATPPLFFARALSVTIIALPYTIDTHARYGLALGKLFGSKKLVPRLVNVYMALANAVLSVIVVSLYVRGVEVSRLSRSRAVLSLPFFTVIFFTLLSPIKSLIKLRPADKGYWGLSMKAFWTCGDCNVYKTLYVLIVLVAMLFLGFIAAGPSISIFWSARVAGWLQEENRTSNTVQIIHDTDFTDLESWFHCSSVSWWRKAVQILP